MRIREANREDLPRLYPLFKKNEFLEQGISQSDFDLSIQTFYFKNPKGVNYQWLAESEGSPVAHHAAIPMEYRWGKKRVLGGLGSNLVIDSPFRSGLLFLEVQKQFFRNYASKGIDFIYGLVTRKEVLKIHLRTGFRRLGDVFVYARPYRLHSLLARQLGSTTIARVLAPFTVLADFFLRFPLIRMNHRVEEVARFGAEIEPVIARVQNEFEISAAKTVQILNWRFFSLDYRQYRLFYVYDGDHPAGFMVCRIMPMQEFKVFAIVDLVYPPERPEFGRSLLKKAHELAIETKVDLAATLAAPHSPFLPLLSRAGFLKTPEYFTLVIHQPKGTEQWIQDDELSRVFKQWHVNWFDHDFV